MRGLRVEENRVSVVTGPDSSEETIRLAWFALEHSAGLALTAAGFFGQKYTAQSTQRELAARSRELHEVLGKLREAAVARGWDKNPFPDYWKFDEQERQRSETELVEVAVKRAIGKLLAKDGFLIRNDVNERSITHWLASHLQREFPSWQVDCEYNRNHEDPKTLCLPRRNDLGSDDTHARTVFPDIIVHSRNRDDNLLVMEVKKSTNPDPQSEEFDKRKLKAFKKELGYRFAVFISLATDGEAEPVRIEWIDQPAVRNESYLRG